MKAKHLNALLHMLGQPEHQAVSPYRNYACVNSGDPTFIEMERLGLVHGPRTNGSIYDKQHFYYVTDEGRAAAMATLPAWREYLYEIDGLDDGPWSMWAATMSKARAKVVENMRDAWEISFIDACKLITIRAANERAKNG